MSRYSNPAKNNNAAAGIAGNKIDLKTKEEFTLEPGFYYLNKFETASQTTVTLNGTPDDPIVIFLDGPLFTATSTEFVMASESPRSFFIFSNSSEEIRVQPKNEFRGMVYAPYADVKIQPNSHAYGAWGANNIQLQPNGNAFVDTRTVNEFLNANMTVMHWKEVR